MRVAGLGVVAASLLVAEIEAADTESDLTAGGCVSFAATVDRAAAQWPKSPHYALDHQISRSFVAGYNRVRTGGEKLVADEVEIFPMLAHDTWYVLAGNKGCFVFWTELAPDLMQKLMDNGPRGPIDPKDEAF